MPQKMPSLWKCLLLSLLILSPYAASAQDEPNFIPIEKERVAMPASNDAKTLPEAYQPEFNGVMRMYNLFPRSYKNINEMTADLPRIREMGFTHVWINPIHTPTSVEKKKWPEGTPNGLKGSLYAMKDPYQINPDFSVVARDEEGRAYETGSDGKKVFLSDSLVFEKDRAAIRAFTDKAKSLGMVPMFDLVLSHISPDSGIVDGTHRRFQGINTAPWFDRYANGQPKRHGLDQDGNILPDIKYPDKEVWDDVVMFKYDDPAIRSEITEKLWKPFVKQYLDWGFMGIRVDSVANNNAEVMGDTIAYFSELHKQKYGVEPQIIGESLGGTIEAQSKISPYATHLYNSAYWTPLTVGPNLSATKETAQQMWGHDDNWFLKEMGQKQALIFRDKQGNAIPGRKGGTVGYAGSHDELPWVLQFPQQLPAMDPHMADEVYFRAPSVHFGIDAKTATRSMREKIAQAALASDGGWFITSFDDKLDTTLRSVFDKHHEGVSLGDLTDYIKDLNRILKAQPQTQFGSWAKRFFLEGHDELVIIERHTGFDRSGPANLIILNTDPEQTVVLSPEDISTLARQTGRPREDFLSRDGEKGVWLGEHIAVPEKQALMDHKPRSSFASRVQLARERVAGLLHRAG